MRANENTTILVVDDDPDMVRLIKECLELLGYIVITGYDGQMAIQRARAHRPGLIIMDVQMPVTNGLKAFQYLRQSAETNHIPVLFLSGAPSNTVYPVIENQTRVAFIKKPLDIEQLESLVSKVLPLHAPQH